MTDHNAYERPEGHEMPLRQKRCKFRYNKYFERVTVLTNRDKEIMDSKGFRNVEVLHNPLFLKTADTVAEKDNVILAVGRIDAWNYKGFDLLINAWNKIFMKYPDWKLKIVGSGSDKTFVISSNWHYPQGMRLNSALSRRKLRMNIRWPQFSYCLRDMKAGGWFWWRQ